MTTDELHQLRCRMDAINLRLCAVLEERAQLCRAIGAWKQLHGVAMADPARETAMLTLLLQPAGTGFDAKALARILRLVFDESRAIVMRATTS